MLVLYNKVYILYGLIWENVQMTEQVVPMKSASACSSSSGGLPLRRAENPINFKLSNF